jgi:hypothetical protein
VVVRAIDNAEALLQEGGPTSAVDRVHTSLHGHLPYLCDQAQIQYGREETMVALLKKLRQGHPSLQNLGPRANDIDTCPLSLVVGVSAACSSPSPIWLFGLCLAYSSAADGART